MKMNPLPWVVAVCAIAGNAASFPELQINVLENQPHLRVAKELVTPLAGTRYRMLLESSADLDKWVSESPDQSDLQSSQGAALENSSPHRFYRLKAELEETGSAADGAELFGYDRIFREELRKVGFLTAETFAQRHDLTGKYLEQISFDPRTAKFWDAFKTNTWATLSPAEMELFLKNGFVVSDDWDATNQRHLFWPSSFAAVYYAVMSADLPVFVSADAILHAWHFSYQRLLEEAEETQLSPALETILRAVQYQLSNLPPSVRSGAVGPSVLDAEYVLGVARKLLNPSVAVPSSPDLTRTLDAINRLGFDDAFPIFGTTRPMDFSQFKVRGHYDKSEYLARYFRAMMWLARADLRIFTRPGDPQSLRELGAAIVLGKALRDSGQLGTWKQVDDLIRFLVGRADCMDFPQLDRLLTAVGIRSLSDITSTTQLAHIQDLLREGGYGVQWYAGDVYGSPFGPEQTQLPRVFAVLGQRFVPDGWALAQVTFDRILWNEDISGITWFKKVLRRQPSALDVAYATLGNLPVGERIAERMLNQAARANFRDGYPYAHHLAALAATFDRIDPTAWNDSLYTRWLAALRLLSKPTTHASYPEAMRTKAWLYRTLNTQLASYTELKHDTVLYAKQPYVGNILCEYPAGFIEPVPEFWRALAHMAHAAAAGFNEVRASGIMTVSPNDWDNLQVDLSLRKFLRVTFCQNFARQMEQLAVLSEKELQQQPFTVTETEFVRGLMNRTDRPYAGPTFDGWYPGLFYKDYLQQSELVVDANGSNKEDPLVTDIFTATPDTVDPTGGVLHEATGRVDVLLIAVDNGPDRVVYAGPTLSHYEFLEPGPQLRRLSDFEWIARLGKRPPTRPDWTRAYMVAR